MVWSKKHNDLAQPAFSLVWLNINSVDKDVQYGRSKNIIQSSIKKSFMNNKYKQMECDIKCECDVNCTDHHLQNKAIELGFVQMWGSSLVNITVLFKEHKVLWSFMWVSGKTANQTNTCVWLPNKHEADLCENRL